MINGICRKTVVVGAMTLLAGIFGSGIGFASASPAHPVTTADSATAAAISGTSTAVRPDLAACLTHWSGRMITSNCAGIGVFHWRQWALCSASGTHFTSPPLTAPPTYSWGPVIACPAGQTVTSGGVTFS